MMVLTPHTKDPGREGGALCWAGSPGLAVQGAGALAKLGRGQESFRDHIPSVGSPSLS